MSQVQYRTKGVSTLIMCNNKVESSKPTPALLYYSHFVDMYISYDGLWSVYKSVTTIERERSNVYKAQVTEWSPGDKCVLTSLFMGNVQTVIGLSVFGYREREMEGNKSQKRRYLTTANRDTLQ